VKQQFKLKPMRHQYRKVIRSIKNVKEASINNEDNENNEKNGALHSVTREADNKYLPIIVIIPLIVVGSFLILVIKQKNVQGMINTQLKRWL